MAIPLTSPPSRRGWRKGWPRSISSRRRYSPAFTACRSERWSWATPYHCHCRKTARLLAAASGRELEVAFQSRFGRAKWLEPATDKMLAALPGKGVKRVALLAPGFSADCLETLEELAIRGRDTFLEAGGTHFAYLPCLNDSLVGIEMLRSIVGRELEGWLHAP